MADNFPNQIYLPGAADAPQTIQDEEGRCWEITGFEEDVGNLQVFDTAGSMIDNVPCCEECEYDIIESSIEESSYEFPSSSTSESEGNESSTSDTDDYGYDYDGYNYNGYYGGGGGEDGNDPDVCVDCCTTGRAVFGFTKTECIDNLRLLLPFVYETMCSQDCLPFAQPDFWTLCVQPVDHWATYEADVPGLWSCGFCCESNIPPNDPCDDSCGGQTPTIIQGPVPFINPGDCALSMIAQGFIGDDECVNTHGAGWEECGIGNIWESIQGPGGLFPGAYECGFCCENVDQLQDRCEYTYKAIYNCESQTWGSVYLDSQDCDVCVSTPWHLETVGAGNAYCVYSTTICGDDCNLVGDCTAIDVPTVPTELESECGCPEPEDVCEGPTCSINYDTVYFGTYGDAYTHGAAECGNICDYNGFDYCLEGGLIYDFEVYFDLVQGYSVGCCCNGNASSSSSGEDYSPVNCASDCSTGAKNVATTKELCASVLSPAQCIIECGGDCGLYPPDSWAYVSIWYRWEEDAPGNWSCGCCCDEEDFVTLTDCDDGCSQVACDDTYNHQVASTLYNCNGIDVEFSCTNIEWGAVPRRRCSEMGRPCWETGLPYIYVYCHPA